MYINDQQMQLNIYDISYSQYSHQHFSAGIAAIFKVIFLLLEYNRR